MFPIPTANMSGRAPQTQCCQALTPFIHLRPLWPGPISYRWLLPSQSVVLWLVGMARMLHWAAPNNSNF